MSGHVGCDVLGVNSEVRLARFCVYRIGSSSHVLRYFVAMASFRWAWELKTVFFGRAELGRLCVHVYCSTSSSRPAYVDFAGANGMAF